jgi:hypothetical protein
MTQPRQRIAQRRTNIDELGAFTFSYRRLDTGTQASAWMLDRSAEEAAFLTAAGNAPEVGEYLELTEMEPGSLFATERPAAGRPHLPRFGRVVRLYGAQGTTRRVTIRFEPRPSAPRVAAPLADGAESVAQTES